ncbi:prolipoprotein diacylglyceryl transferase [Treponema endosymbiont of Eucomonympha sp.]|uniref:prolipoprotein diacylglyceryl transferase n=1 Tax=Treponema endosymbiont of Eucomonympha sp. TaxID=1580831 RepID=UPI000750AF13|nr:prolipoprotein diacylglyceryl transferase [Treponema endosymbiont of Eucomonympha sp.]
MLLAITYPSWIHPEILPGVPVLGVLRWYGLMYIFAFATAFLVLKKLAKEGALSANASAVSDDDVSSCISTGILFLLVGARLFSTLVYDTSGIYRQKPWLVFWPFEGGRFTGLAGMSYHGGFIGGLCGIIFWCRRKKQPFFKWLDAFAVAIPLGYTFGRIGNFLNGELFGRVTTAPWGVIFPRAETFSYGIGWVRELADKARLAVPPEGAALINLPRHPSQLYEAFFEGIALFALLWRIRKHKPFDGFLGAAYTVGYGVVRFCIEYFREPDTDLGYRFSVSDAPTYLNESLLNISTGQVLSLCMIAAGLAFIAVRALTLRRRSV